MAVTFKNDRELYGLSTDNKPTSNIATGTTFFETDSGSRYFYDGSSWIIESVSEFRCEDYIINTFQIHAYSGFTNQPTAGKKVQVQGGTAAETGLVTIFGADVDTGAFIYTTVTTSGTAIITTTLSTYATVYGAYLGDIYGKNRHSAISTISILNSESALTTITTGNFSVGMISFDFTGKDASVEVRSGSIYVDNVLVPSSSSYMFTATNTYDQHYKQYAHMIATANATATVSIIVFK